MEIWTGSIFITLNSSRSLRHRKRKENSQLVESRVWEIKVAAFQGEFAPHTILFEIGWNPFTLERQKGMISYLLVCSSRPCIFPSKFWDICNITLKFSFKCPENITYHVKIFKRHAHQYINSLQTKTRIHTVEMNPR